MCIRSLTCITNKHFKCNCVENVADHTALPWAVSTIRWNAAWPLWVFTWIQEESTCNVHWSLLFVHKADLTDLQPLHHWTTQILTLSKPFINLHFLMNGKNICYFLYLSSLWHLVGTGLGSHWMECTKLLLWQEHAANVLLHENKWVKAKSDTLFVFRRLNHQNFNDNFHFRENMFGF
jgi:hypothetical protein